MMKLFLALILIVSTGIADGQPTPCPGYNILLLDTIKNVSKSSLKVSLKKIKGIDDASSSDNVNAGLLTLSYFPSYKYCEGYAINDVKKSQRVIIVNDGYDIILVENGAKKMYIISSLQGNEVLNQNFRKYKEQPVKLLRKSIWGGEYFSNIEFQEGVFLAENPGTDISERNFIKMPLSKLSEMFSSDPYYEKFKDADLVFFDRYHGKKPQLTKLNQQKVTEKDVARIAVKYNPEFMQAILSRLRWKFPSLDSFMSRLDNNQEALPGEKKQALETILLNNYDILLKFRKYIQKKHGDVSGLRTFLQKNNNKTSADELNKFF